MHKQYRALWFHLCRNILQETLNMCVKKNKKREGIYLGRAFFAAGQAMGFKKNYTKKFIFFGPE